MRPDADLVRAVVGVNVLISAVLSARGQPAEIRKRIPAEQAAAFIGWLRDHGTFAEDPADRPPVRSPDPGDDHLLALAISLRAFLVTGDQHLLGLRDDLPILTPAEFVSKLEQAG
ncbi:MAG TPA: hypothetical protein VFG79_17250 [Solirubrobacter sp.]|nr:hypothetical protein [Solirubrobacter sp.]